MPAGGLDLPPRPSTLFDDEFQLFQRRGRSASSRAVFTKAARFRLRSPKRPGSPRPSDGSSRMTLSGNRAIASATARISLRTSRSAGFEAADIDHHVEFLRAVPGKLHSLGGLGWVLWPPEGKPTGPPTSVRPPEGTRLRSSGTKFGRACPAMNPSQPRFPPVPARPLPCGSLNGADIDQGGEIARARRPAAAAGVVHLYVSVLGCR